MDAHRHDRTVGASVTVMEHYRITRALRFARYESVSAGIRALLLDAVREIEQVHTHNSTASLLKHPTGRP